MQDPMLVYDNVLVLMNLSNTNHRVPAKDTEGKPIYTLGKRALSSGHRHYVAEEGIREIEIQDFDFLQCPTTLRKLDLPVANQFLTVKLWRKMSIPRWQALQSCMIPLFDEKRKLYTGDVKSLDLESPLVDQRHLSWIPENANELIYSSYDLLDTDTLRKAHPCIGIRHDHNAACPVNSLVELVRAGININPNPEAELFSDDLLKNPVQTRVNMHNSKPFYSNPSILILVDEPIRGKQDVLVCFTLMQYYWHFCSTVPVVWHGTQYYVGCLNYMGASFSNNSMRKPYFRRELGVFSEDGLVSDREITEAVYDKYLLMSFV